MITGITSKNISKFWDSIKNAIIKSDGKAEFLKMYPIEYIKERIEERDWQCWTTGNAIFLTSIQVYPTGLAVFDILYTCGSRMEEWNKEAWLVLKAFAKSHGCDEIKFNGRKGWGRYGKQFEPGMATEYRYKVEL